MIFSVLKDCMVNKMQVYRGLMFAVPVALSIAAPLFGQQPVKGYYQNKDGYCSIKDFYGETATNCTNFSKPIPTEDWDGEFVRFWPNGEHGCNLPIYIASHPRFDGEIWKGGEEATAMIKLHDKTKASVIRPENLMWEYRSPSRSIQEVTYVARCYR